MWTLLVLILTLLGSSLGQISQCPLECGCYLDGKGRNVVECKTGGLTGPLSLTNVSEGIEILRISAPEDNANSISMSPNIAEYRRLEEIHITRSNIPNLGDYFFYGLEKLEVLDLSQNNITQPLPENFQGVVNLRELYLDDNRINSLPSETFRYLTNLRVLSLQKNRVKKMMPGVFRGLSHLRVLKLNGNSIKSFNPEVFKNLTELRVFECRGCLLTSIDPKVHVLIPLLTHLDFGENEIGELKQDDFSDLVYLRVLKLDANRIDKVTNDLFPNNVGLKKLILARNRIDVIESEAFSGLFNLTELDLGYNKVRELGGDLLGNSPVLERLVLSGNIVRMENIKELLIESEIKDLQMADMGLSDISYKFIPDTVSILNLGGNQLSYLRVGVLPGALKDLDISRNMFRGLDRDTVERLNSVRCKFENNPWSCDLCHIVPMLENVNRSATLYNLRCAFPHHFGNKVLGNLQREQLSWCSASGYTEGANFFVNRNDGRLGIIAAGASLCLLLLTALAVLAALCYSRRHAAKYYTHEEKRDEREAIFENSSPLFGEELSFKFPLDNEKKISIATIEEIKNQQLVTNGH